MSDFADEQEDRDRQQARPVPALRAEAEDLGRVRIERVALPLELVEPGLFAGGP